MCAFWADFYDCEDNWLSRHWFWHYDYMWSWNARIRKFELIGSYGAPHLSVAAIDWKPLEVRIPWTQDRRLPAMKQAGCCPAGLIHVAYQFYQYTETRFERAAHGTWMEKWRQS